MNFYGLSVIEIPMDLKPCSTEVFLCKHRDGLGYLHRCWHKDTKYLQCEMAIHYKGCPIGLK